jgi:adenylyltransferase/sulfurtransferase
VLVIGAGGLGSPLLLYLAAAGVGRIGVVDDDAVDLSNLQRQVVHDSSNIGMAKTESAKARLTEINPEVAVETHQARLTRETALDLVSGYDLVADGSDNFPTRYLVNDACYLARKTLVSAAILRFDGQLATFKAHLREPGEGAAYPCYRCLFGNQPPDTKESCADVGVLGALAGALGSLQAIEVVKELLGVGRPRSRAWTRPTTASASPSARREARGPNPPRCHETRDPQLRQRPDGRGDARGAGLPGRARSRRHLLRLRQGYPGGAPARPGAARQGRGPPHRQPHLQPQRGPGRERRSGDTGP